VGAKGLYLTEPPRSGETSRLGSRDPTNVAVLLYDDHDRAIKLLHSLNRTVWSEKV
jgi:hypothetical protein